MRIAYTCHDGFPSSDTNTQQIFWTILEVSRLGAEIELFTPPSRREAGPPAPAVADWYGAPPGGLPAGFTMITLGSRPAQTSLAKGWFDWRLPARIPAGRHRPLWTRDPLAAASCVKVGRRGIF